MKEDQPKASCIEEAIGLKQFVKQVLNTDDYSVDVYIWWWRKNEQYLPKLNYLVDRNLPQPLLNKVPLFNKDVEQISEEYAAFIQKAIAK